MVTHLPSNKFLMTLLMFLIGTSVAHAQTTLTTTATTTSLWSTQAGGALTFGIKNTNSYPIRITNLAHYLPATGFTSTYTLWYHPTQLTGAVTISALTGWHQIPASVTMPTSLSAGITPIFSNLDFVVPPNTTYRMAFVTTNNGPYYGTAGGNQVTTAAGVELHAGPNPTTPTYYGYYPSPPNVAARYFYGSITFVPLPTNSCSGMPLAGTAASLVSSACPNGNIALSLTGYTDDMDISIQWEVSPAGQNTWSLIPGGNLPAISTTQSVASDYRAIVTCANGGFSATSNVVSVALDPFYICYCSLFTNQPLHTALNNYITNVAIPGTTLSNPTTTWGVWGHTRTTGILANQTAVLQQGSSYPINVTVGTSSYNVAVWIDFDQNGIMDAAEYTPLTTSGTIASGNLVIPVSASAGLTGMRIRAHTTVAYGAAGACTSIAQGFETEDYVVTIDFPLAIKLSSIAVTNKGRRNKLEWKTAKEASSDKFELERSLDGKNFSWLGTIGAKGEASSYTYWDESPGNGVNYYRIRMVDEGGQTHYSKTVSATVQQEGLFLVEAYPSPVVDVVTIKVYGSLTGRAVVTISDINGKMIRKEDVSGNETSIDIGELAQGTYLIKYTDKNHSRAIKVNKR